MLNEECVDICEELGWRVDETGDGYVELGQHSPAGEDFNFLVEADGFVENVKKYAQEFDIDEHTELWIPERGTRSVPSSIQALLDDATDIKGMLKELAASLGAWQRMAVEEKEQERWVLGKGLSPQDNLLDGITFEEIITTVQCNCRKITPDEVKKQAMILAEMRIDDMCELMTINASNIAKEAKARRN